MGKVKKAKKQQPKSDPLKIHGSFEDVIRVSVGKGSNKQNEQLINEQPKSKGKK